MSVSVCEVVVIQDKILEIEPAVMGVHLVPDGGAIAFRRIEGVGLGLVAQLAHPATLLVHGAVDEDEGMAPDRDIPLEELEITIESVDHAAHPQQAVVEVKA